MTIPKLIRLVYFGSFFSVCPWHMSWPEITFLEQNMQYVKTLAAIKQTTLFFIIKRDEIIHIHIMISSPVSIGEKTNHRLCSSSMIVFLSATSHINTVWHTLTRLWPLRPKKSLNSSRLFCSNMMMQLRGTALWLWSKRKSQYLDLKNLVLRPFVMKADALITDRTLQTRLLEMTGETVRPLYMTIRVWIDPSVAQTLRILSCVAFALLRR